MADFQHTKQYAMGVREPSDKLEVIEYTPPPTGDHDVLVDVQYCGMCHSDLHKMLNDWAESTYNPALVPGHEVVGIVKAVGPKVTTVKVGDRVGYGPQRDCCHACHWCTTGADNCCPDFKGLYDPAFGGYATSITVPEHFTFAIPDAIPSEVAGPLMCAGITTFAPLAKYVKPGDKVGVIGIGGLGHMGLQYAAAMGAQVWAISTSAAKEAEARKFGAQHFLVSKDAAAMKAQEKSFDFILCSATGDFPLGPYLKLLKPRTKFCLVGLPAVAQPLRFEPFDIVSGEKEIVGSMIGSAADQRAMLEFSAKHKCFPQCEVIDFANAQAGITKMHENSARYRTVLKIAGYREAKAAAQ